jgi:hypothetical protein
MDDMTRPVPGPQPDPASTVSPPTPATHTTVAARASTKPPPTLTADERRTSDERTLIELRRKVQAGEMLSASTERLLWKMKFNGHLTVVVQNGRVIKSGYEEGYFRRKNDLGGVVFDS